MRARALGAAVAAALLCASCKRAAPPPQHHDVLSFFNEFFVFSSSQVLSATRPGGLPDMQLKVAPAARYATVGEVHLVADPLRGPKSSRAAAEADARELKKDDGTLLGEVRRFQTRNGSCFGYSAVHPPPQCFTDDGEPTPAPCYEADLIVHCESPKGARYLLTANLGFVTTASALTPAAEARQNAVVDLLASLGFK